MSRVLILCEGYDDQAFWKCWLLSLGAVDHFASAGFERTKLDEHLLQTGVKSSDGDFCLGTGAGDIFIVRPCHSQAKLWSKARVALKDGLMDWVIVNCDSDRPAGDPEPIERRKQRLEQIRGNIAIDLVVWHCDDSPGLRPLSGGMEP